MLFSFKKFLTENYLQGLQDEFDLDWNDIVKIYEDEPWIANHIKLGREMLKTGSFKIVPGTLSKDGADVIINYKNKSYFPDKKMASDGIDNKVFHLNKKQLLDLLTRGWIPS